jgi:hypothetical protein
MLGGSGLAPTGEVLFFLVQKKEPNEKTPCRRSASHSLALLVEPGGGLNSLRSNRRPPKSPGLTALLSAAEGGEKRVCRHSEFVIRAGWNPLAPSLAEKGPG